MTKDDIIRYWRNGANEALRVAEASEKLSVYTLALFHCHLAVEKALKSAYIAEKDSSPPKTHNLWAIAEQLGIEWTKSEHDALAELTTYAVAARYDDLPWMERKATKETVTHWLKEAHFFVSRLL